MANIDISKPLEELENISKENGIKIEDEEFAKLMDSKDVLQGYREKFEYPKLKHLPYVDEVVAAAADTNEDCIYLCGNSLGLMPKNVRDTLGQMLEQWAQMGVYGHHVGDLPWYICDEQLLESMSKLVGAKTIDEIALMNQLTSNLHFMLMSFYEPKKTGRYKIMFEAGSFPSDHYAFESQVKYHGYTPDNALVLLKPRAGEHHLRTEDIEKAIRDEGNELAVVCLSGVQYYTGQLFDIEKITKVTQEVGAYSGWDLAHAVGSVELKLHEWNIDFAVWTTYKYLNAGCGNTGGAFLHEKHFESDFPHLYGWWGHCVESRMDMTNEIHFGKGIRKYRMSTPSALHCAALRGSLKLYDSTDMFTLLHKSRLQIAYFEYVLEKLAQDIQKNSGECPFKIITPRDPCARGCQLSVMFKDNVETIHKEFKLNGLVCDERKPNVLRLAMSPFYNSYMDAYKACQLLKKTMEKK